jgi:outer membrane protein assembly factor BamB
LWAIRPDGHGDVTDTHVAWKLSRGIPRIPSPLAADGRLYMVSEDGAVTCHKVARGRRVWRERIGGNYASSRSLPTGCSISAASRERPHPPGGRQFAPVATNGWNDGFMASPAVDGGALYLRTKSRLYRIESTGPAAP